MKIKKLKVDTCERCGLIQRTEVDNGTFCCGILKKGKGGKIHNKNCFKFCVFIDGPNNIGSMLHFEINLAECAFLLEGLTMFFRELYGDFHNRWCKELIKSKEVK